MPGEADPLYVAARRTLLDSLEAVRQHLDAVVLVGAQAVYIHTGEGELEVAPYTTDGDLALDPERLAPDPLIEYLLDQADFALSPVHVGRWAKSVSVEGTDRGMIVDLLVPATLGGPGRRGARIPPHNRRVARKAEGLEGALVDRDVQRIGALDSSDSRSFDVAVAGPSALLVAKIYKIEDRASDPDRRTDKDALDVFRLLQAVPTSELVRRLTILVGDELSREVTSQALDKFAELFGSPRAAGCAMAARAAAPLEDPETIAAAAAALSKDLIAEVEARGLPIGGA
jgi:hypothetical protein